MANENNEFSDIVKKCKILLLDIEGTTTSISFVKDKLFPYAEENVKEFLEKQWDSEEVKEAVAGLRKLAAEDQENKVEGVVAVPAEDATKEEQVEGLVKSVKWLMAADRKVGPLKQLQGLIWKLGYDKGDIKGHVYDDVAPAFDQWRSVDGQKIYIYSSGSVQAQKLLFGQSVAGDLLPKIEGHFDTAVGAKQEAASYAAIVEKIGSKPEEILFLTDIVKEAEAARSSGLYAALVSREGNAPLPSEATASFPVIHSFDQLTVTNKRKPEHQDEEVPAKVPKTDIEDNVKTAPTEVVPTPAVEANGTDKPTTMETTEAPATETITKEDVPEKAAETPAPDAPEPEKMEVEEESPAEKVAELAPAELAPAESAPAKPAPAEPAPAEKPVETEEKSPESGILVEEITDPKEIAKETVSDVEPIVEESGEKTEKIKTEKMEAEPAEEKIVETATEPKEPTEQPKETPVAKETPPTVITEIEDVTNDQEKLQAVDEIIEDLVPVVEEPSPAEDLEELQNVGENLEKECDEILSKVHDVTNLENIPVKPLLNTIAEETMETENTDSNDIVDRILDTEMELAMKPSEEVDLNTAKEITETKPDNEGKSETAKSEEKVPENKTKENDKETKEKTEESSAPEKVEETPIETKVESVSNGDAKDATPAAAEEKMETVEKAPETSDSAKTDAKIEESKEQKEPEPEQKVADTPKEVPETKVENGTAKVTEQAEEAKEKENGKEESQVNGKTTNGDLNLNGNAKDEELSARLSVENGKEPVNGANGGSAEEKGQDEKVEKEIPEIKVKSVAVDEPRTDPIEQPTEA